MLTRATAQRNGALRLCRKFLGSLIFLAGLSLPHSAIAQDADASDLTEGQPLHLDDAEAGHGAQVQGTFRYSRTYEDEDQYYVSPQLQVGIGQYWHYQIAVPVLAGPADRTTSGDIQFLLFRQLNTEQRGWPAFAIAGEVLCLRECVAPASIPG